MEDALDGPIAPPDTMPVPVKNGEVLPAPELDVDTDKESNNEIEDAKVNGDAKVDESDAADSSDCDTLVIDERPQSNRKRKLLSIESKGGFKGFKRFKSENDYEPPTNPYFNESLFELSELHQKKNVHSVDENCEDNSKSGDNDIQGGREVLQGLAQSKKILGKKNKKNGSPKLREYAQYLGLQPTVQFKCSRCAQSGFPSLAVLNEHHKQCRALGPITPPASTNSSSAPSTNFRVTRKVFLCSACGTYYENWNLFLHMREVHKRFICLYCLGMFSLPEKLSLHLVSKHNCVPNQLNSEEDFFQTYKDPCYLMCCDCEKVFSERDNFFGHNCVGKPNKNNADNKNKNVGSTNRHLANQKPVVNKNSKQIKNKSFVEHVTGDMPQTETEIPAPTENETTTEVVPVANNTCTEPEVTEIPESTPTPPEESNKENIETNGENNLETNSLPEAQIEKVNEEKNVDLDISNNSSNISNSNPDVSDNSPDVMETDAEVNDVKIETDLPNNETNLDTTEEENHLEFKESESEDELDENPDQLPARRDSESSVEQPISKEEENETTNPEEQEDEVEDAAKSEAEQEPDFEPEEETRKVPKVTLKLPKIISTDYAEQEDSDGSDKLTMEVDSMEAEDETDFNADVSEEKENKDYSNIFESSMVVAGSDISIVELELEQPLDKFDIQVLLQKCLKATVPTCVYCNHARKIAVNGKQLGLHAIAEHRFSAIVNSITAEELIPESFVMRIKEGLLELENVYFNLESTSSDEGITFSHVFECFQCRYATTVHKELYLHNRKMHAKTILLCIMCKSNFYSYSELICHLCPGLYELNNDVSFRCCMCVGDDLPSAFRLLVHLRKRHHACDVCLELCHNQSRLSNHVWKHKLHHLCYRCGIAYRNKPDITKHLFWKHGTESVLCKKCLQKKWPHVYHFCIPPPNFTCEECNLNFGRAVSLKVHKRLHTDERPHACTFENCNEKFISKKLLLKHEFKHREPPEDSLDKKNVVSSENPDSQQPCTENTESEEKPEEAVKDEALDEAVEKPKPKPKVDVYDLPELNLSETDSSDSEDDAPKMEKKEEVLETEKIPAVDTDLIPPIENSNKNEEVPLNTEISETTPADQPVPVLENIWDDFKNYQASKEKLETTPSDSTMEIEPTPSTSQEPDSVLDREQLVSIIMMDHDYSVLSQEYKSEATPEVIERTQSMDHDYCSANNQDEHMEQDQLVETPKTEVPAAPKEKETKASSSSDSSGSDSSSCTCGSNCSCSSSSDSSSSSSDSSDSDSSSSEGRRKQQARRDRRKQRAKNKSKESENSPIDVVTTDLQPSAQVEQLILETDLDTTESDTDEDFYDKQPQKVANKLLAEKRKELLLLAGIGPLINGSVLESSRPSTPSLPETEEVKPKKKSKNKKKKKKSRRQEDRTVPTISIPSTSYQYQPSAVSPLTISLPKNSPLTTLTPTHASPPIIGNQFAYSTDDQMLAPNAESTAALESSLRASKRRRIPNKFYGYTSDEERERHQPPVFKWRKADLPSPVRPAPSSPLVVPPITIKTVPTIAVADDPQLSRPLQISEHRIQQPGLMQQNFQAHHSKALIASQAQDPDSSSDSNDSTSDEEQPQSQLINKQNQPPLYCYCRCPYDEVSEMIGCDSNDCLIEWFHFECVGIMVPPKGQWFCPDCRKKKHQRKELGQT